MRGAWPHTKQRQFVFRFNFHHLLRSCWCICMETNNGEMEKDAEAAHTQTQSSWRILLFYNTRSIVPPVGAFSRAAAARLPSRTCSILFHRPLAGGTLSFLPADSHNAYIMAPGPYRVANRGRKVSIWSRAGCRHIFHVSIPLLRAVKSLVGIDHQFSPKCGRPAATLESGRIACQI